MLCQDLMMLVREKADEYQQSVADDDRWLVVKDSRYLIPHGLLMLLTVKRLVALRRLNH